MTALTLRAEDDFVAKVLTILSSVTVTSLAEKLEELRLFTDHISHDSYPLAPIRQFVTRHLRRPENHQALDILILSNESDLAWLEPYVGNLQVQDKPAHAFIPYYGLPDYSGYDHIGSDNEGDEEEEEEDDDDGLYPYDYDDGFHDDSLDSDDMEPDDLDWMHHLF